MSEVGVKETKEAAIAILKLSAVVAGELKDGFQIADLVAIVQKALEDESISAGFQGLDKVAAEVKDLNGPEIAELVGALAPEVVALISALGK